MRLKHIEVFNAIMLSGSVSAAARILNVTQPAVTQTLKHAEQQLGYALFLREKGGLKPTPEARHLYLRSKEIFEQVDELRRLAQSLKTSNLSQFRIAIVPSLSTKCLSTALSLFKTRHPHSAVSIKILHSDEIARAVALQEFDLGIAYGEIDLPSVDSEVLGVGHLVWVEATPAAPAGPAGHVETTDISIAEMASREFIGIDKDDPVGKVLLGHLSESAVFSQIRLSAQTYQSALLLTLDGFGPCVIDSFTAGFSRDPTLSCRSISPRIPVAVSAVSVAQGRQRGDFVDFLQAFKTALSQGGHNAP
ncbi:LysR family transcriptional regulator [Variovorax sp. J22G73]|uniref:LysR family transcriptional regulator n=1 Tax=unclassified Variovorax TaxID=663243 RepID=UPI002576FEA4|nr:MULTISPECIES: LysR family transcriptional regulator [unclassified Variovorax]MDM0008274.1 LysR family transcriptional regulator [Variovorax sp. J22R203]MDM0100780.1 LysR family transcriptional regulator [Variovorax sp. J22G73]